MWRRPTCTSLPQKTIDDILLQVHGDMRRFEEARTLMLRLAHRSFDQSNAAPTLHYGETAANETDFDGSWSNVSDYWTEKDWNDAGAYYNNYDGLWDYDGWHEQSWNDGEWYQQENFYDNEEDSWYEAGWKEEITPEEDPGDEKETVEDFYKGKGKHRASAMGLGCSICGSKWHNTYSCPMIKWQEWFWCPFELCTSQGLQQW